MRIVPFTASHVHTLVLQPMQRIDGPISFNEAAALEVAGPSFSLMTDDGRCLGAAGAIPQWKGRAIAWALLSPEAARYFVRVTRAVKNWLDECDFERIEAHADALFPASHRWLEMLGFERETPEPMRRFSPEGRPAYLYARIAP